MKATKIFAAIIAMTSLCISCNRFDITNEYKPATEKEAPAKYVPYQAEYINVPQGKKTMVYMGSTLVATCYKSGYVVLPKVIATKALEDYQIVNVEADGAANVASENELEMVVAFEDTRKGDHDYNDLVFQAKLDITNSVSGGGSVDIQLNPVALGASLRLGLGIVLTDAEGNVLADKVITTDCRDDLFGGDSGFINTQVRRKKYNVVPVTVNAEGSAPVAGISWYLLSSGQKLFASNYFQPCLDEDDVPQGLVLMKIRPDEYYEPDGDEKYYCGNDFWQYPTEYTYIGDVYPGYEQAFLEGGDFSVFANPASNFYDAIAAEYDGCLTSNSLYKVFKNEDYGVSSVLYYDNTGKAYNGAQSFNGVYNTFKHEEDNFIIEFSTANKNAIDFGRGDIIEAKITDCVEHPFNIGYLNPDVEGKTIEGYSNGQKNWWRIQDAHHHETLGAGLTYSMPLTVRISKNGIEYLYEGEFKEALSATNPAFAAILELGTDKPLYFGEFGNYCSKASYEYLMVIRNCDPLPIHQEPTVVEPVHVESIAVEDKWINVGNSAALTASVLPADAVNKTLTWASDDESVATVDPETGEIQAISEGYCTVTATSLDNPNVSGSCTVVVCVPRPEVMLWENLTSNMETLDVKELNIIASGVPTDNEICFNNGDYIEIKFHRLEITINDKDILFVGNTNSAFDYPNICIIGHSISKNTNIYMIPGYWWQMANEDKLNIGDPLYFRLGRKADGSRGCGSVSRDGYRWKVFESPNDFEAEWQKLIDPAKGKLVIQTGRNANNLTLTTFDYVKIVREGASE